MLCDNCGKREANVRYSENINGAKRELNLCEDCSQKLGIGNMDFSMPIDFSSFFGEFMEDFGTSQFMPLFDEVKNLKCNECGYTFEDIASTGKLGCANCYDVFESKLDLIIKRIQGSNTHIGRIGKISDNVINPKTSNTIYKKEELNEVSKLKEDLKQAIKEEKYEEAAKLRDEITRKENQGSDKKDNKENINKDSQGKDENREDN